MAHTFTNILVHLIFSTKDREARLRGQVKERVLGYVGGIVRELGGIPVSIDGASDHVHLLMTIPATVALADAVREIKTNSSRWCMRHSRLRVVLHGRQDLGHSP